MGPYRVRRRCPRDIVRGRNSSDAGAIEVMDRTFGQRRRDRRRCDHRPCRGRSGLEGVAAVPPEGTAARHQSGGQAQSGAMAGSWAGVRIGGRYSSHGGRSDLARYRPAAAIAVLRAGLNYSLEREIVREEGRSITCAARASSDWLLRCASESPPTTSSSLPCCSSDKACHLSLPTLRDRCSPRGLG